MASWAREVLWPRVKLLVPPLPVAGSGSHRGAATCCNQLSVGGAAVAQRCCYLLQPVECGRRCCGTAVLAPPPALADQSPEGGLCLVCAVACLSCQARALACLQWAGRAQHTLPPPLPAACRARESTCLPQPGGGAAGASFAGACGHVGARRVLFVQVAWTWAPRRASAWGGPSRAGAHEQWCLGALMCHWHTRVTCAFAPEGLLGVHCLACSLAC